MYPFWRALGLSILSYLAYLSIMATILLFTILYDVSLPGFGEQDLYLPLFGNSMIGVVVLMVVAVLIAPIVEEILFRGYIQGTLEKYISPTLSLLITALIFSLSHFQFVVVIPLFILGLLLGALRNHTRSISVPIMFHMLNNVITLVVEILFIFTP
jgi:membrane protease YdiL (CAAX protease family)